MFARSSNKNNSPVLPKTSLCAIVRDEKINPAGGIVDFVRCTLPFVERAVIVDTGSIDGTRELLTELQTEYPRLDVYDYVFDDHANARNFALSKVRTRRALVLDADERLSKPDFAQLKDLIKQTKSNYFRLGCMNIYLDDMEIGGCHNPRLFDVKNIFYKVWSTDRYHGEFPYLLERFLWFAVTETPLYMGESYLMQSGKKMTETGVKIKHFLSTKDAMKKKHAEFYKDFSIMSDFPQPSTLPSYAEWKEYNPKREIAV
jgi:glycosyltransferase involved in cell wall biosynthesis